MESIGSNIVKLQGQTFFELKMNKFYNKVKKVPFRGYRGLSTGSQYWVQNEY